MAAKPLKWSRWLKRHRARLQSALLGPWLDLQQEREERTPWIGWVVVLSPGSYLMSKGSSERWDREAKRWIYKPVQTQYLEQAKVYQSRKAAVTSAKRNPGAQVQGVVHVLLGPEKP